jgi:glycosyltransferase involved in cell wall biosynthesis
MKICFVGLDNLPVLAPEYNKHGAGGEQVQQTLLARALSKRGFDVSMIVFDYGQPDGAIWDGVKTIRAYAAEAGIPVFRFIHPRWSGLWSALRRANADVYYVSCSGARVGQVAHFARHAGKRVIYRVAHDRACDPKTVMIRLWRDKRLYEYGLRNVDAILVQSFWQQAALQRNYGLSSTVAGMLVEPRSLELGFEERNIDALWVNNMRPFKRADRFLDFAASTPSVNCHMIGGPGSGFNHVFDEISRRASTIPSLVFHGPVPYHEVNDFYERSRVFVNTSDSEGLPNSYLQAWMRGTPVVAFFDPDGVIRREGLGEAVSSDSELQAAIIRLNSDVRLWREVSLRCRNYMHRHFDEDAVLVPYISALQD